MKKILIITYYYPPCRGVPSYRPSSWAKDFHKHGFKPTIITRHWNGKENVWEDYLQDNLTGINIKTDNNSKTIRLPYSKSRYLKLAENKWMCNLGLNKLVHLFLAVSGNFQKELDGYTCFKSYLFKHLKSNDYKLVIVTSPPLSLVRLASKTEKKFSIPFIVDFQDSWNNRMLNENYNPRTKEKFHNSLKEHYLRKWLKNASLVTTVTPSIGELIKKVTKVPIEIITNGFEKGIYVSSQVRPSKLVFNISLMGTIHPMQDISIMLKGLNIFLQNKTHERVQLNFIGLDSFPDISNKIKKTFPEKFINVTPRVSMNEAVKLTLSSSVLLFPSYKGYKGYYTAKIFEYLGAERNILMVPGNNDIVDELILKTKSGKIANSENEFADLLNNWFVEWEETGVLKYDGIEENINHYSRENQNKLFCKSIMKHLI